MLRQPNTLLPAFYEREREKGTGSNLGRKERGIESGREGQSRAEEAVGATELKLKLSEAVPVQIQFHFPSSS